jgi:starch phosphorylase
VPHPEDPAHPYVIGVHFPGRQVFAQLWRAQVGRIPLYLLDTNLPQNNDADRFIAGNLYGGDSETRIQQEIVLGIGGIHALAGLGITPTVCHMNEGHRRLSGFGAGAPAGAGAGADLLRGRRGDRGRQPVYRRTRPVPAGFDIFSSDQMRRYFEHYAREVNLPFPEFLDRGRVVPGNSSEQFNMAALAFRHARYINGVSRLHGEVTREMVQPAWPGYPQNEIPVARSPTASTPPSFLSKEMTDLLDNYFPDGWREDPA